MSVPVSSVNEFAAQGYTVARGLFSLDEVQHLRQHFLMINQEHRRDADNIEDPDGSACPVPAGHATPSLG